MPSWSAPLASTSAHASALPGQPSCFATSSVSPSTTGELAIDVPLTREENAPRASARCSHTVESGIHTSGCSVPSDTTSDSAAAADSRLDTCTEKQLSSVDMSRAVRATTGAMSGDAVTLSRVVVSQPAVRSRSDRKS
jgi:hypothetical protein